MPDSQQENSTSSLQLIRPKELAELLSVSMPTLFRMYDELPPRIKLSKNGRAVGWRMSDIEAYLEEKFQEAEVA